MNPSPTRRLILPVATWSTVAALACIANTSPAMDRVREFLAEGAFVVDVRARYEQVEQADAETANAVTLRTRLGYLSRLWKGFNLYFEAENVASPFPNAYNQSQLNEGGSDKAIVTDPTGTNVSQAWVNYTWRKTSARVGRQRLTLDNGRFVGDYAWRQHLQTLDGIVIRDESLEDFTFTYGYIVRVNRVFGPRHVQGVYQSDSHLLHGAWKGMPAGTLSAYAYLLDFEGAAAGNSSATYGLAYDGEAVAFERVTLGWRAEYAMQTDYGRNPIAYDTTYMFLEGRATLAGVTVGAGYEVLGAENGFALRTPIGSLHDFNGWADSFTTIPATGLRDTWFSASGTLPWWQLSLHGAYHSFDGDDGTALGTELDLAVVCPITESFSAGVKYASFSSESFMRPDVRKIWVQCELKF